MINDIGGIIDDLMGAEKPRRTESFLFMHSHAGACEGAKLGV
jgi:hypothetical protein